MGKAAATLKYRARTTPAGYRRLEQALLDMGLLYNAIITQRNAIITQRNAIITQRNAIITQRNAATRPTATATAAGRPTATSPSSGSMSPTAATCTGS